MFAHQVHSNILDSTKSFFDNTATTIKDGFKSVVDDVRDSYKSFTDSKTVSAIQNKLEDFNKDAKQILQPDQEPKPISPSDRVAMYISQQSLAKTQISQTAIDNLLSDKGELNPNILNDLIAKHNTQSLEVDYHMALSKQGISGIKEALQPLVELQNRLHKYRDEGNPYEQKILGSNFNKVIYDTVNLMFEKRVELRRHLSTLSMNNDYMRRSDFDLDSFYFMDKYNEEAKYLYSHSNGDTEKIYNIFSAQRDVFENRIENNQILFEEFNRDLSDLYKNCENIYKIYAQSQKRAELFMDLTPSIASQLDMIFELRERFAEKLLFYESNINDIEKNKPIFEKIFETTDQLEILEEQANEINVELKKDSLFVKGYTEKQKKKLKTIQQQTQNDIDEIILGLSDAINNENNPSINQTTIKERAKVRSYLKTKIDNNFETRQKTLVYIRQSLKDASTQVAKNYLDDQESPEDFFKRRDIEIENETMVNNLKSKIDKGDVKLADINDQDISNQIVTKTLSENQKSIDTTVGPQTYAQYQPKSQLVDRELRDLPENETNAPILKLLSRLGRSLNSASMFVSLFCSFLVVVLIF